VEVFRDNLPLIRVLAEDAGQCHQRRSFSRCIWADKASEVVEGDCLAYLVKAAETGDF
jgi:hypothetical protein